MLKYELIPKQLLHEGVITTDNLFEPEPAEEIDILLTHDPDYWNRMKRLKLTDSEMRKIGFPLSQSLVERELRITQGTIDCALHARRYGIAMNVAGGTHHAFTNKGEGFCLLNDFAVAANYLLANELAYKILIIDLDVHQGNGTAQIFAEQKRVFTLSMHGRHNYPFFKEKSDLDIALEDGTDDYVYLQLMRKYIPTTIENLKPDFVFYLSGVDILQTDRYGKLNITPQGCAERDKLVFDWCKENKLPVVVSMGGGYSPKISDIVNAHCNTFKSAIQTFF